MTLIEAVLESWERQCRCLNALFGLVTPELESAKPSEDGMTLMQQFAHVALVRSGWLEQIRGEKFDGSQPMYRAVGDGWEMISDRALIRTELDLSQATISAWLREALTQELEPTRPYDHPLFYLQHMIWHEGYHVGLIMLGLRLAGAEPSEEWEELNLWSQWRDSELG